MAIKAKVYEKLWKEGTVGVPTKDGLKVAHFWVKVYDEGSEYGIDGGRISKLTIEVDGRKVVNYDRGWDIEPDENDKVAITAYSILMKEYN